MTQQATKKQAMTVNDVEQQVRELAQQAKLAARVLAGASAATRNAALLATCEVLHERRDSLLEANALDMARGRETGLDAALLDRLELTPARLQGLLGSLQQVAALPDPVGAIDHVRTMPSGIRVGKMRVPLGVIAIIYESRPNVTVEAASLCLKAGNAAILRGLPAAAVRVVPTTDRAAVGALITASESVDLVIPRGGKGLIERISGSATVPVLKHLDGICHVYIDGEADAEKALAITLNAKTQRYGTCNTLETLLVAEAAAGQLPAIAHALAAAGVELRGCGRAQALSPDIRVAATEEDWQTEYLAPILSVKVVADLEAAMAHIARYSSGHTESIVTENHSVAMRFLREVDSSSVMINASTRFADGFEYGLGAEIGISTDKLHARGPVGLEGLTSSKYVVFGDGHIRQ